MAINFPSNPSNEQQVTFAGTTYTYNSAKTKWEIRNLFTSSVFDSAEVVSIVDSSYVSSRQEAAGVTVYANRNSLPASGNTAGDQAYVTANNRLYIWNGTGWYNIALLNLAPSIQSVLDSDNNTTPFSLAIDGTPTTITITATDSDGDPITYGYSADSNFGGLATLSQANNVFTITPFSQDSATTVSGTITFTATDDVNVASSGVQTFTLNFLSPLWDETVLSVGTSSTNSLNNSTFIDRSTNSHTVTSTGTPTQTAFHPYLDNWSAKFTGGGSYLSLGVSSDFHFDTGDYTVEVWVNPTDVSTAKWITGIWSYTAPGNQAWSLYINGGKWIHAIDPADTVINTSTSDAVAHAWTHIAIVRDGDAFKLFVNGVLESNATSAGYNMQEGNGYVGIGNVENAPTDANFKGHIADLHVIKGYAKYTSNFTPSTELITPHANTVLLTCRRNRFYDESGTNKSISLNGSGVSVSGFSPYGGQESEYAVGQNKGSTYFDGASSINTLGSILANHTWTIEFWGYITSFSNPNYIISVYTSGAVSSNIGIGSTGFIAQIYANSEGLNANGTFSYNMSNKILNQWCHIAITHEYGGSSDTNAGVRFFVNGVDIGTHPNLGTYDFSRGGNDLKIGVYYVQSHAHFWNGHISDFTITPSVKYTAGVNFTPPTTPVGNTNASLYLSMDNVGIFDKTGNSTITLTGNTASSTTQTKFADTAIYFDGSGDMTETSYSFNNISNYTVEYWIYWTNKSGYNLIWSNRRGGNGFGFYINSPNYALASNAAVVANFGTAAANQWVHIAHVWSSGSLKTYINGSLVNTYTDGRTMTSNTTYVLSDSVNSQEFQGYIENFQVLQTEKYTTNFTPPIEEQGRTYQGE